MGAQLAGLVGAAPDNSDTSVVESDVRSGPGCSQDSTEAGMRVPCPGGRVRTLLGFMAFLG